MVDLTPDTDATVDWLRAWHGPEGPWLVVEIDPSVENPTIPARRFTDVDLLRAYLEDRNGIVNLYFVPNGIVGAPRTTPTKEQIGSIWSVYVDLDLPRSGPHSLPTPENFELLLGRIRALEPPPTAIVYSGGGYQAFWRFPEPVPAGDFVERAEATGKAIARDLGSDAVQNVNRLMRLPGTVNLPSAAKLARGRVPALATVVEADWARVWSYGSDAVPHLPEGEHTPPGSTDRQRNIGDLSVKLQKAIRSGDASSYGNDRSRLVFSVTTGLIRRGWPDEDIVPLLINPTYLISSHCLAQQNPQATARRQVERARQAVVSDWERTTQGSIDPANPKNVRKALADLGIKLSHNVFQDRSYVNGVGPARLLDDPVEAEMRVATHDKFGFLPTKDAINITTSTLARQSAYHPVVDYLSSLTHDPTSPSNLTEEWIIRFGGAKDTPFIRAVSRLILVAAVRRVRSPGCKFDEMLVLISPTQGTEKSVALSVLAVNEDWFTDSFPLKADEKKTIEQLSGRWIVECAELQGIHQSDVETVKSILSRQVDRARLAYGHHPTNAPRQCVFFGTTNSTAFLRDRNNRRFWPVYVTKFDIPALHAARDALWAEAAHLEASNISIRLDETLWEEASIQQDAVRQGDPWTDILVIHLADMTGRLPSNDVWKIINKPEHQRGSADNGRLTEAMLELGWERSVQRIGNTATRCFVKGNSLEERRRDVFVYRDLIDNQVTVSYSDSPTRDDVESAPARHVRQPPLDDDVPF